MKRILVTGGAGFIGSHLVEQLGKEKSSVLVADDMSQGRRQNLPRKTAIVECDICDATAVGGVMEEFRPEVVVHLAAQVNVRRSIEDPAWDAQVNVLGGLNVLGASGRAGVRRVVFASSGGAVYGNQPCHPVGEEAIPNPISPYALSKHTLENYGRYFSQTAGTEFVALRLANVYGPRQDPRGEAGVISIFLDKMRRGEPPTIFGDGSHTRDYLWVGDAARAFVLAMSGPPGVYNIGTGVETRTVDVWRQLKTIASSPLDPVFAPAIPGEVLRNSLDCSKARAMLGWSPRVSLDSGLSHLVLSREVESSV